jgi:photosystem II stability/assembly factor-like uncharacterized protein
MNGSSDGPRRFRRAMWTGLLATLLAPITAAHSPHDVIKQMGVTLGITGNEVIFAEVNFTSTSLFARSFDGGETWVVKALPLEYRDVTAIEFSPRFAVDDTAAISTNDAGLLFSKDAGETWTLIDGGGLDPRVLDVAFSTKYASDDTLWAATATGLFVSSDDGQTWAGATTGMTETNVSFVEAIAGDVTRMFAGKRTIHRSDDSGATWTPLHTFAADVESISVSPGFVEDRTLVVALRQDGGVFTSQDGGFSWQPMVDGLGELTVNDVDVGRDGTVLAVTRESACYQAIVGESFQLFDTGFEQKSGLTENHYRHVALHPKWPQRKITYVGGFEGFFRSNDSGASYRPSDLYSQEFNRQVVFAPDFVSSRELYLVNYGGGLFLPPPSALPPGSSLAPAAARDLGSGAVASFASPTAGGSGPVRFETLSDGVLSVFGQSLVLSPQFASDRTMFYSQVTFHRSGDAGQTWTLLPMPPGEVVMRALAVSPDFPGVPTLWAGFGLGGGVWRSPDAGESWEALTAGLPASPQTGEIMVSPAYGADQTLYLSSRTDGMFKSSDGGDSWSDLSAGLPSIKIHAAALSPGYPAHPVLLLGSEHLGVWRSADAGASWQEANTGLPTGTPLTVERFAFSPDVATSGEAYVVVLEHGVFHSSDAGASWQPVGPGLPADASRVVALSPDYPSDRTLAVSTHDWTWVSDDAGNSWSKLPGYARIDDFNYLCLYTLGEAAPDATPSSAAPFPDELAAWLAAGACPGDETLGLTSPDVGVSWPATPWAAGNHGLSVHLGMTPGDLVEFDFRGDSVRWFAARGPDGGIARVQLDGTLAAVVDLYAPEEMAAEAVFERVYAGVGSHTIRVLVTGQSHPQSSGIVVRHDGFDVTY